MRPNFFIRYLTIVLSCFLSVVSIADDGPIPVYGYKVVNSFPHDPAAFTQGLIYKDGVLYESTGRYGQSSLRKIELETGKILRKKRLPSSVFAEGIVDWKGKIIGLTWRAERGFVWQLETFDELKTFTYEGEGWGLTRNSEELFKSNGSAFLEVLDPVTLQVKRTIAVMANGKPVRDLNELEWVEGEIFANIWQSDRIARIDPVSGRVVGWIDLRDLLYAPGRYVDVLNGIAYDPKGRLFVTGKLWPKLFEIQLVAPNKDP